MVRLKTELKAICRSCGKDGLLPILSFEPMPLAEQLLTAEQLCQPVKTFPLNLVVCPACLLVQLEEIIAPEELYGEDYVYLTSTSQTLLQHFGASARSLIKAKKLNSKALVVEAGSNDGHMLKIFLEYGIQVLGIDPAIKPARIANECGVTTICDFFTKKLACQLTSQSTQADIFLSNNILNIVPDINDFVAGIQTILKATGTAVIEVPYFIDIVDTCAFDYIFHHNFNYFTLIALDHLFRRHKLFINEVHAIPTFGGSLRIFINHYKDTRETVRLLLKKETEKNILSTGYFKEFADRIKEIKDSLSEMLWDLKGQGKRIIVYGTGGGMSNTLLNFIGVNQGLFDYAVDSNKLKHGRYLTRIRLLIYPPEKLVEDIPDYVLITAWNYADEIIKQQEIYSQKGGKFIVPIPNPKII